MARRLVAPLLVLGLAAVLAVCGAAGSAGAAATVYSHTWSPPLNLPSSYRPCCPSTAAFTTLPFTMDVTATHGFQLTVRMRTNWQDTKAVSATPNIIQQGRVAHPLEIKISIHSGPLPKDHHAQCRIEGANGVVVDAQGPKSIDIADGGWHTIQCVKSADSAGHTQVQVIVDGLAGPVLRSLAIGNITFTGDEVDLGGQGPQANKDSIDGQYQSVSYVVT
jgi:hypothetical protein